MALQGMPPRDDAPASVWVLWHERHIACWERLAATDTMYVWHLKEIGGSHDKALKELVENPATGGRRGYWSP